MPALEPPSYQHDMGAARTCPHGCNVSMRPVFEHLEMLFDDSIDTDIEFIVIPSPDSDTTEPVIFKAHRSLVLSRFPHLEAELEPTTPGSKTSFTIHGSTPDTIWRFLKWCYIGQYSTDVNNSYKAEGRNTAELEPQLHLRMYALGAHYHIPELTQAAAWGIHGFWEWVSDDQWVVDGQFKDQLEDWGDLFLACTRATFEVVWHPDTQEDYEVKDIMVGFARHKMFAGGYGDNEVAAYRARLEEVPGYTLAYERHRCVHCPKGVNALANRVAAAAG